MYTFVYGTLKIGEPNHHWLTDPNNGSATFVGTGVTQNKFPLIIASRYNIPFLVDKEGTGKNVHGEVYEIDEKMLASLDVLEEYPKLYTRKIQPILLTGESAESGQVKQAWTYLLSDFKDELLNLPHLDSYLSDGSHNLPYVARYVRDMSVDHRPDVKNNIQVEPIKS